MQIIGRNIEENSIIISLPDGHVHALYQFMRAACGIGMQQGLSKDEKEAAWDETFGLLVAFANAIEDVGMGPINPPSFGITITRQFNITVTKKVEG